MKTRSQFQRDSIRTRSGLDPPEFEVARGRQVEKTVGTFSLSIRRRFIVSDILKDRRLETRDLFGRSIGLKIDGWLGGLVRS
jgi:hypothetical protein